MDTTNDFSPQESIKLIRSMIESTKHSISDHSHFFLIWGWAVFLGCLLQYYLKVIVGSADHYLAWLVTPVALVVFIFFLIRDKKREKYKTIISEASAYLWTSIGLSFFALMFVFSNTGWQYCYPVYIILYGIGTYVSGRLIKFKPLVIGGLLCFPLSAVCSYYNFDTQILFGAAAIFISYIIPGHLLRAQYKKQSY